MSTYMYGIIFSIILGVACAITEKEVVVKEGDSLFLPCKGNVGFECIWIRIISGISSEVIAMTNSTSPPPRYYLTDTPQLGDCSLNITDIKPDDSTTLSCSISPTSFVIRYEVIIGVEPNAPHIEYNNQSVNDGDLVIIETPAEIKCVVEGGKPGANVSWENEHNDIVNVTAVVNGELTDVINTLKIDDFPNETKPEKKITCVAHHPLYPKNGQLTITLTVGKKYKTMSVDIIENKTYASCVADGIPRPNILWQFKEENSDEWKNVSTSKTISLDKNGDYRCQAGNALNGNLMVPSTNNVTVSGNANPITPTDGTTSSTTEVNPSTDEKNPSTDEANTSTDEANTSTDEANTSTDESNTSVHETTPSTNKASNKSSFFTSAIYIITALNLMSQISKLTVI